VRVFLVIDLATSICVFLRIYAQMSKQKNPHLY
jgi:hypothetical protein